jgi:hypothetical protein
MELGSPLEACPFHITVHTPATETTALSPLSDVDRYVIIRNTFCFQHTCGFHTPVGNADVIIQDFSSVRLPT